MKRKNPHYNREYLNKRDPYFDYKLFKYTYGVGSGIDNWTFTSYADLEEAYSNLENYGTDTQHLSSKTVIGCLQVPGTHGVELKDGVHHSFASKMADGTILTTPLFKEELEAIARFFKRKASGIYLIDNAEPEIVDWTGVELG